jgi:hypothetical protein
VATASTANSIPSQAEETPLPPFAGSDDLAPRSSRYIHSLDSKSSTSINKPQKG